MASTMELDCRPRPSSFRSRKTPFCLFIRCFEGFIRLGELIWALDVDNVKVLFTNCFRMLLHSEIVVIKRGILFSLFEEAECPSLLGFSE